LICDCAPEAAPNSPFGELLSDVPVAAGDLVQTNPCMCDEDDDEADAEDAEEEEEEEEEEE
jgi:hypothetical protein